MTVDGRTAPTEQVWEGWPGYAHSAPVRSGNEEAEQHQLDGYGWIVDAAWQYHRVRGHISRETWRLVRQLADFVAGHWREPDAGIWEERREPRHYGHSELMAYLALDRAIELAADQRLAARRLRRWRHDRRLLADQIREHGLDVSRNTYVRSYGDDGLDAALPLLPVIRLDPPDSPRVRGTIDAVRRELSAGGALLYRASGYGDIEGAFLPCFTLARGSAGRDRTTT